MAPPIFRVQGDILTKNNPNIIKLVLELFSYINTNRIMKKKNILKLLEIIYDETNNCITESRANNYWCTVNEMSEENFQEVKSFYIDFVNEALPGLLK